MARILVVEDDPSVRSFMEKYLARNGFEVTAAETGEAAYEVISKEEMDLIILDLMLPGDDGLEITRKIRRTSDVPIIMVTARSDVVDRVVGLEVGADDYLPKPFEARELLARVRSVLRRTTGPEAPAEALPPQETSENKTARFADWIVDPARRDVRKEDGEILHLSTAEFDLLTTLISSPEKPLSRDQLLDRVYGREGGPFDRSIDVLVMRLRSKIEADRRHPRLIKSVRGIGYMFAEPVTWT